MLLVLTIILFIPLRLCVSYKVKKLQITVNAGKIKFRLPAAKGENTKNKHKKKHLKKIEKKESEGIDKLQFFFNLLQAFYETSVEIKKTVIIEKINIESQIGFEDASVTGVIVGLAYAEMYKLIAFLSVVFETYPPDIMITPVFEDKSVFTINAEGIIRTKLAHIICTVTKFYINYKKTIKERVD